MTEDLRISMIQSHIIWEDREENLGYYGQDVLHEPIENNQLLPSLNYGLTG